MEKKIFLIHFISLLDNGYNTKCQNYNQVILKFRVDIYFSVPALGTTIMAYCNSLTFVRQFPNGLLLF